MDKAEEIKKLREMTGMNRKEFCEYFKILTGLCRSGSVTEGMRRIMLLGFWHTISEGRSDGTNGTNG